MNNYEEPPKATSTEKVLGYFDSWVPSLMSKLNRDAWVKRVHASRDRQNYNPDDHKPENSRGAFLRMLKASASEQDQIPGLTEILDDSEIYTIIGMVTSLGLTQKFIDDPSLLLSEGISEAIALEHTIRNKDLKLKEDEVYIYEKLFMEREVGDGEVDLDSILDYKVLNNDILRFFPFSNLAGFARLLFPMTQDKEVKEKLQVIIDKDNKFNEQVAQTNLERERKELQLSKRRSQEEIKEENNRNLNTMINGAKVAIVSLSPKKQQSLYEVVTESNSNTILSNIKAMDSLDDDEKGAWEIFLKGDEDSLYVYGQMVITLKEVLNIPTETEEN